MDYLKPGEVASIMAETARRKLALPPVDITIRGALSGAILGVATSLAFTGAVQTGQPLVGAFIFPVGLIIIVLLGLELVTGSFALVPLPWLNGRASSGEVLSNWGWVFTANLLGANVSIADWWLWNQIPVTLGNFVGGFLFTGLAVYATYKSPSSSSAVALSPHRIPAE